MAIHDVVIAGGGPTGLMLAAELALAQVDVLIVERRSAPDPDRALAGGLHARTIEVLDQRGVADRFLEAGKIMQIQGFGGIPLDISDFPSRHPYGVALPQAQTQRLLTECVEELNVPTLRGREVTGFTQDATGVDVALSDGTSLRASYLVGCDGGHSVVRKAARIEFAGWDPSTSWLMAEIEVTEQPEFGRRPGGGIAAAEEGRIRVVLTEPQVQHAGEPTLQDVRTALIAADGTDYCAHRLVSSSRFTDNTRQATSYRQGRVLLAGDAAHVHPPLGGQGLNTGIQDAVNLGWKLAQVVRHTSPERLLDTYHDERHPVGARVLQTTMAQVALTAADDRHQALRTVLAPLLSMEEPRRHMAATMSGLDIHYDLGPGHPLLGRRMPDLDLATTQGPQTVAQLLHAARPVLLEFDHPGALGIPAGTRRVLVVGAEYRGPWELPVLGRISAPTAVLIRPDGHVAWVGEGTRAGLPEALTTWFGYAP